MEEGEAEKMEDLEKTLLDNDYSLKVKEAIIEWYSRH
jgi:hypothetical protein